MAQNIYRRIKEKLQKKYRVELIDDVTLYQTRQFMIKPISVALVFGLLLVSIIVGTAAFVVYTPTLHTLIPDYQNPDSVRIHTEEQGFVSDSLKAEVEKRDRFALAVQKVFGTETDLSEVAGNSRSLPVVDNADGRAAIEWEDPIEKNTANGEDTSPTAVPTHCLLYTSPSPRDS